jgi:hypothetical protein
VYWRPAPRGNFRRRAEREERGQACMQLSRSTRSSSEWC